MGHRRRRRKGGVVVIMPTRAAGDHKVDNGVVKWGYILRKKKDKYRRHLRCCVYVFIYTDGQAILLHRDVNFVWNSYSLHRVIKKIFSFFGKIFGSLFRRWWWKSSSRESSSFPHKVRLNGLMNDLLTRAEKQVEKMRDAALKLDLPVRGNKGVRPEWLGKTLYFLLSLLCWRGRWI